MPVCVSGYRGASGWVGVGMRLWVAQVANVGLNLVVGVGVDGVLLDVDLVTAVFALPSLSHIT